MDNFFLSLPDAARRPCLYNDKSLHSVLYTGVSSELNQRVQQHKYKVFSDSFTAKYSVIILVYYQFYPTITEAILEEKES